MTVWISLDIAKDAIAAEGGAVCCEKYSQSNKAEMMVRGWMSICIEIPIVMDYVKDHADFGSFSSL